MNPILVKEALATILDPHVLINMVSQRVRQLNSGHGGQCRPLVEERPNESVTDIALREIIEEKMSFELPEIIPLKRPTGRNRRRPQHWVKNPDFSS
jgi:DNA-directed RNA polymerase subunit omega